jgi:ABC-type polysaccharide/polyol phosphate export permease
VLDLLLTRILLEIAGATVSLVVLGALWISIGWCDMPQDILKVMLGWLMLAWFGTALGCFLGALTSFSEIWERLWTPLTYLLFPLSGAVFMVDWLPKQLQQFVLWIPMVHPLEYLRDGWFGSLVRTHYDLEYFVTVTLGLTLVGLAMVKDAARRIRF